MGMRSSRKAIYLTAWRAYDSGTQEPHRHQMVRMVEGRVGAVLAAVELTDISESTKITYHSTQVAVGASD